MVKPPELSPFGAADDADLAAAFSKPGCEDAARRDAANPVRPLLLQSRSIESHVDPKTIRRPP
jgi:hypothetical protein